MGQAQPETTDFSLRGLLMGGASFLLVVVVLVLVINAVGLERLRAAIAEAGPLAPLFYVILKALTYVFAPLTAGPIQISSGVLFGLWPGVWLSLVGEVIGGSLSFWIARLLGRPVVRRLVGQDGLKQVDDFYDRNLGGWRSLVYARLFLFSVYDFVSYAAGFSPLSYRAYFVVSVTIGFIPTFAVIWFGTTLAQDTTLLMVVFAVGGVLSLIPLVVHLWWRRRKKIASSEAVD